MVNLDDTIEISLQERKNRKRNIIRYLILLFSALVYVYFFGGLLPYTIFYLMISLPIMSVLHLLVVCVMFRMSEKVSERTFVKGECASYGLILQNPSFFYMPYITVNMQMEGKYLCKNLKSMRLSLAPFSSREFKYEMPLMFRGRYDIGINNIEIQDMLGIVAYKINPFEKKSILVKPRLINLDYKDIPVARISEGDFASGFQEIGNDDIRDIREYSYGDSLRKVHWKLSSKLSKTMVKETRNELDNDIIVVLNLEMPEKVDEDTLNKEDCVIEELVSQIYYLLRRNIPVKLCFYKDGPSTSRATTPMEFEAIYQILSEVKFNQEYDFNNVLDYFTDIEQNSKLVYIFTTQLDGDIIDRSYHIKNKGFDIELFYVGIKGIAEGDFKASDELADALMKSNIKAYMLQPGKIEVEGGKQEIHKKKVRMKAEVEAYETNIR